MAKRTPPKVTPDTPIGRDVDLDQDDVRLNDGTRLTEDIATDIVEQVRRSTGRPPLSGNAGKCRAVPANRLSRAAERP